jgi:hypothetical protein
MFLKISNNKLIIFRPYGTEERVLCIIFYRYIVPNGTRQLLHVVYFPILPIFRSMRNNVNGGDISSRCSVGTEYG